MNRKQTANAISSEQLSAAHYQSEMKAKRVIFVAFTLFAGTNFRLDCAAMTLNDVACVLQKKST